MIRNWISEIYNSLISLTMCRYFLSHVRPHRTVYSCKRGNFSIVMNVDLCVRCCSNFQDGRLPQSNSSSNRKCLAGSEIFWYRRQLITSPAYDSGNSCSLKIFKQWTHKCTSIKDDMFYLSSELLFGGKSFQFYASIFVLHTYIWN